MCVDPVQGLESVSVATASNSTNAKALLVTCPFGKKLYDVGGGVSSGSPLTLTKVEGFTPGSTNGLVTASELVYGTFNYWGMFAQGVCAP